jgi:hypothetical protein
VPVKNTDKDNHEGFFDNVSFGFVQTVRKEWKCSNGRCQEVIKKCKNGKCESAVNNFQADNYKPDVPKIDPFPIPELNFSHLNFAELFKNLFTFDFPSPFNFDNSGSMDLVVDNKNSEYYFSNAKFVNSKCIDRTCEIKTKTCVNGKCDEATSTNRF